MIQAHGAIWEKCLQIIKDNIPPSNFNTWFSPIYSEKFENNVLTLHVPSYFFYEYLEEHYVDILQKTLNRVIGEKAKLKYKIGLSKNGNENSKTIISSTGKSLELDKTDSNIDNNISNIKNPFVIPGIQKLQIDSQLNPYYTFDNFIEGTCNRLARSAGIAIARSNELSTFNPMFLYGESGLGKTHLIHAIGLETQNNFPEKKVLYISSNRFQTQFTEAVRTNNINDFIHFYQIIDLLIIDDIHELADKTKTQQIFFHIFNHLHYSRKQLIITSDKPPSMIQGLEERLLSRFKWGLTADLSSPNLITRKNILKQRLEKENITVKEEIIDYIAIHVKKNIRELEGTLISLIAHSVLNNKEIDLKLTQEVVKKIAQSAKREITINFIKQVVCDYFNLSQEKFSSKSRKREIVQARQIAMFYSKKFTKDSLSSIGSKIGNKDHATVLHAHKTVCNLMETDNHFRAQVEEIGVMISM